MKGGFTGEFILDSNPFHLVPHMSRKLIGFNVDLWGK